MIARMRAGRLLACAACVAVQTSTTDLHVLREVIFVDQLVNSFADFFLGMSFVAQHLMKLLPDRIREQINL